MHDPKFVTPEERAKHVGELYEMLESIVIKRSSAEWLALLQPTISRPLTPTGLKTCNRTRISLRPIFQTHQHPTEGKIVMAKPPITFSRTPASVRGLAPNLGEHNKTILNKTGKSGHS